MQKRASPEEIAVVGRCVQQLYEQHGCSKNKLAKKLGVDRSTIRNLMSGEMVALPTGEVLLRMAEASGIREREDLLALARFIAQDAGLEEDPALRERKLSALARLHTEATKPAWIGSDQMTTYTGVQPQVEAVLRLLTPRHEHVYLQTRSDGAERSGSSPAEMSKWNRPDGK